MQGENEARMQRTKHKAKKNNTKAYIEVDGLNRNKNAFINGVRDGIPIALATLR